MKKLAMSAVVAMSLAGCVSTGHKVDSAAVAQFQPGVTTIGQVEAAMGQPFQATRLPDGGQQLQYVSKYQEVAGDGMPTTGSRIPKRVEKTVSTVLLFDPSGHFVSASSSGKTQSNQQPSDLGTMNTGDVQRKGG